MGFLGRLSGKKDDTKQLIVGNKPLKEGNFGDDAPCNGDWQTVCQRVEDAISAIFAAENDYYELYRDVSPWELGGDDQVHPFTYGIYCNRTAKLMILILEKPWGYKRKDVEAAHELCRQKGIACMNLMLHLPNRKSYIINRIRELLNN